MEAADAGLSSGLRSAESFLRSLTTKVCSIRGVQGEREDCPQRWEGMDVGVARREVYEGIFGAGMDLVQSPTDRSGMCV